MNSGLKNKLMVMAAAAGLAGFGAGCASDGEAPAVADEAAEATSGGEASCAGAAEEEEAGAVAEEGASEEEGEAACGAGSCGG